MERGAKFLKPVVRETDGELRKRETDGEVGRRETEMESKIEKKIRVIGNTEGKGKAWGGLGGDARSLPAHLGIQGDTTAPEGPGRPKVGWWVEGWGLGGRTGVSHFLGQGEGMTHALCGLWMGLPGDSGALTVSTA